MVLALVEVPGGNQAEKGKTCKGLKAYNKVVSTGKPSRSIFLHLKASSINNLGPGGALIL